MRKTLIVGLIALILIIGLSLFWKKSKSRTIYDDLNQLSEEALNAKVFDQDSEETTLGEVLKSFEGDMIVVDVWATWCKDCIKGFPKLKKTQAEFNSNDFSYLFLSVDKENDKWIKGINKYELEGHHYRLDEGWDNIFCSTIDLDWIPRYLILDSKGNILFKKAIVATDKSFQEVLRSKERP